MKKLFPIYLSFILPLLPVINSIGAQIEQAGVKQYNENLIHNIIQARIPINNIEQDNALGENIFILLNQQIELTADIVEKRQTLLKNYLDRALSKKAEAQDDFFSVDIQGRKLFNALRSNLALHTDLWPIIEQYIHEYCAKQAYRMSPEQHRLFNKHVFNVSKQYTQINWCQTSFNGVLLNPNYFVTRTILDDTISNIASYYQHIDSKIQSPTGSIATETSEQENIIKIDDSPSEILSEEAAQEITEEAPILKAPKEQSTDKISESENEATENKRPITKKERKKLRKQLKAALTEEQEKKEIALDPVIETKEVQDTNLPESAELKIETPEMRMLEYIKFNAQQDLIEKNYDKFFNYAKACYNSESTKNQTQKILQELESSTDNITTLLHIAKLKIDIDKNLTLITLLLHKTIYLNNFPDFIKKTVETGIYKQLIKWAKESTADDIIENEQTIVEYIKNSVISENKDPINAKLEKLQGLPLDTIKKWLKSNIQLLQAIHEKTKSTESKITLVKFCVHYGYSKFCDNFVIKPEELKKYIKSIDFKNPEEYQEIAKALIEKNRTTTDNLAKQCYQMCAEKFNHITSMQMIHFLLAKEKNDDIQNLTEREKWLRKILEIEPKSEKDQYGLAKTLFTRYKMGLPIDIKEIENNLKTNSLNCAKELYIEAKLICATNINFDPNMLNEYTNSENLTNIIIDKIKNQNNPSDPYYSLYMSRAIICLVRVIGNINYEKMNNARQAIKDYLNPELKLTTEEKNKLKEIAYAHPFFTKMSCGSDQLKRIVNTWNEYNPQIKFFKYFTEMPTATIQPFQDVLNCDFELKTCNKNGDGILHYATKSSQIDLIDFLATEHKELFSEPYILNNENMTPITKTIEIWRSSNNPILINMLDILCKVNPKLAILEDNTGESPIHHAARYGSLDLFKHLAEKYDIDIYAKNQQKDSVIELAIKVKRIDIIKYLVEKQKDILGDRGIKDILVESVYLDNLEITKLIFPIVLTLQDDKEDTLEEMLELLIELAIHNKHVEIIQYLINQNIINIIADKHEDRNFKEITKELIKTTQKEKQEAKDKCELDLNKFDQIISILINSLR